MFYKEKQVPYFVITSFQQLKQDDQTNVMEIIDTLRMNRNTKFDNLALCYEENVKGQSILKRFENSPHQVPKKFNIDESEDDEIWRIGQESLKKTKVFFSEICGFGKTY